MAKPTIDEIARCIPHVLNEFGDQPYSGNVDFYKDEIDVKGDGALWAMAEYEVEYNWTHEAGDRLTPPTSDFDVVQVRVKNASFHTNEGDEVEVLPEQATKVLVDYFWANNLDRDPVLTDQIHEQAGSADYSQY